jgi:hypothetical protein
MTQRIFDVENEKDMALLWSILPEDYYRIEKRGKAYCFYKTNYAIDHYETFADFFKIDWHDKTEITRPIEEATGADIGKLCKFWDKEEQNNYGVLEEMTNLNDELRFWKNNTGYEHCRRLTKQEIEELC